MELGRFGVWSSALRIAEQGEATDAGAELEQLGYGAAWLPGRDPAGLEDRVRALLAGTRTLVVATGIVNIWGIAAAELAAMYARLDAEFPGRFLLGIGVSHAPLVAGYRKPLSAMREYLDDLDRVAMPADSRVIAALAPRMLETARNRARGAHPYLVTPEHTTWARSILGPAALLAPEQTVVLDAEPSTARALARGMLETYLRLPNYVNNFKDRLGFSDGDVVDGGSDRLVDGLIAWGDDDEIAARIREHHAAGAQHVPVQVLTQDPSIPPRADWRRLAEALGLRSAS